MQFNFGKGEKIRVDAKTLVFSHTVGTDKHTFIELGTGEVYQYFDREILDKYLARNVEFNPEDDPNHVANTAFIAYPKEHRDEAIRRKAYVDALIEAGVPKPQAKHWPRIIKITADKISDPKMPSYLTVRPWLKAYRLSGGDVRSLIPRHCRKGRKKTLRSLPEQEFLDKLIDTVDNEHRPSKAKIAKIIKEEYDKARQHRDFQDWTCPSPRTIYRMLDRGNARTKTAKRFGTRAAVAKFDHGGFTPEAHYPMEVVEIDHTWMDLHVIDSQYKIALGRPWITAAIDRYTRMLVGVYIGFEPPSIYSVAQCIRNMILPKDDFKKAYPTLPAWEAYGIPVLIVCDNGREFLSESFRNMAAALGTTIRLAPVRNPEYKGTIESFLGTVNEAGLSGLPGRAGSNPQDRGDYDAEKKACMSLQDLREYFFHWLLAEYVWKRHSGINRVPGAFWRESLKRWKPRLPNKIDDLDVILRRQDDGTITKKGVIFSKIRYQSAELQVLFQDYPDDRQVKLRIDDSDLGKIYVIHKSSHNPLPVPAQNQKYAAGLSYYHHLQIRKGWKLKNEIDENCKEAVDAREEFHKLVQQWIIKDSAKQRKTLARTIKRNSGRQPIEVPPFVSGMPTAEEAFKLGEEMMKPVDDSAEIPEAPPSNGKDIADDDGDFPTINP